MLHLWAREYPVSDAAEEAEILLKGWQSTSTGTDTLGWSRCDCAN